jgi:hypothetical protein
MMNSSKKQAPFGSHQRHVQSGSPGVQSQCFDFGFEDADATAPGLTTGGTTSLVSSGTATAIPLKVAGSSFNGRRVSRKSKNPPAIITTHNTTPANKSRKDGCEDFAGRVGSMRTD